MQEEVTLRTSDGQPIKDVMVELFRPRMDILTLGSRAFVWREDVAQYREGTTYAIVTRPNPWR